MNDLTVYNRIEDLCQDIETNVPGAGNVSYHWQKGDPFVMIVGVLRHADMEKAIKSNWHDNKKGKERGVFLRAMAHEIKKVCQGIGVPFDYNGPKSIYGYSGYNDSQSFLEYSGDWWISIDIGDNK